MDNLYVRCFSRSDLYFNVILKKEVPVPLIKVVNTLKREKEVRYFLMETVFYKGVYESQW